MRGAAYRCLPRRRASLYRFPSAARADDPLLLRLCRRALYSSITLWLRPTPARSCGKRMRAHARPAGRLRHAEDAEDD